MTESYYGKWLFTRWYFWLIIVVLFLMEIQNIYSFQYIIGYLIGSMFVAILVTSIFYPFRKKK